MIKKETDLVSFFLLTQLFAKISKSRKRAKQNFQSPKKVAKIHFLKLCYLNISSNFELIELYLFFLKNFSEIVNFNLENFCCRNSGLKNFQKTLRKSIFQYWYFWMIQKIWNLLSYTCFCKKIV